MGSYYIPRDDYLMHYGVKGQKWGIRRFQNPDGTLTAEGRKRYITEGYYSSKKDKLNSFKTHQSLTRIRKATKNMAKDIKKDFKSNKISAKQYEEDIQDLKKLQNKIIDVNAKSLTRSTNANAAIRTGIGFAGYGSADPIAKTIAAAEVMAGYAPVVGPAYSKVQKLGSRAQIASAMIGGGIDNLRIMQARKESGNADKKELMTRGVTSAGELATGVGALFVNSKIFDTTPTPTDTRTKYEKSQQKGSYGSYEEVPDEPYGYLEKKED